MGGWPCLFVGFVSPVSVPPLPVTAVYSPLFQTIKVTFDQLLIPNALLDLPNWFARWQNTLRTFTSGQASGYTATFNTTVGAPNPGLDLVNFAPPPFDLFGQSGLPVAAFSGLNLTL